MGRINTIGKPWSSTNQPGPEAIKKRTYRRWLPKKMSEAFMKFASMNLLEVNEAMADMANNPQKYTALENLVLRYILGGSKDTKLLMDFINRGLPYLAQDQLDEKTDVNSVLDGLGDTDLETKLGEIEESALEDQSSIQD
jgi:hypothetical protein